VILYNPKKKEIIEHLMAFMPKYKWIALENLTTIEIKN
jgi:hypothetical protein